MILTAILCENCNSVLDVLIDKPEPLYVDKRCKCGFVGFYTHQMTVKVVCLANRPEGEEPLFKYDGHEFY